ncbi:MAG: EthD family reductase [Candidatus Baltobacteraceae bacterium]
MSFSRKTLLTGAGVIGMAGLLSQTAGADMGARAVILTLWAPTKDPEAFDKYYVATHAPLVKRLPGLTSYVISKGPISGETSRQSPYHMISMVGFDSMDALTAAIKSPAGEAMVDDLKNFAAATSALFFSTSSL